jgi:Major Facilitator Superfamily
MFMPKLFDAKKENASVEMDSGDSEIEESVSSNVSNPIRKMTVASLCLVIFLEAMTMTFVFSFVYFMVRDFKVGEPVDIGFYCGVLTAAYSFGQSITSLFCGYLSDKKGRRPVLLVGMFGSAVMLFIFGLSRSFLSAVLSRFVCGMFNGNIGVSKAAFAEVADKTSRPFLFNLLGLFWALGTVLGPLVGMAASEKAAFDGNSVGNDEYPYFLPCAICAGWTFIGFIVNLLYLEETAKHLGIYQYVLNIESSPIIEEEITRHRVGLSNFLEPSSRASVTEVFHSLVNREIVPNEPVEAIWDAEALGYLEEDSDSSDVDDDSEKYDDDSIKGTILSSIDKVIKQCIIKWSISWRKSGLFFRLT